MDTPSNNSEDTYNGKPDKQSIADLVSKLIEIISPNASEEVKNKTPKRYAEALLELTRGYRESPSRLISEAVFDSEGYDQLIVVKDINFSSVCEHHLLPFFGECSIGYIPRGKILGLSKFPRLVDCLASKLQIQERLTKEIAEELQNALDSQGVVVKISSAHSCMSFRGIKSFNAKTDTIYTLGSLNEKENLNKFFSLVNN